MSVSITCEFEWCRVCSNGLSQRPFVIINLQQVMCAYVTGNKPKGSVICLLVSLSVTGAGVR
jgi:hypothetical protein